MFVSKVHKILEILEKIKTNVDRLLLVWKLKKFNFSEYFGNFFFIIKTKSSLSTSVFIFSTISQILETTFNILYFGHKLLETGPNVHMNLILFTSITCL